MAYKYFEAEWIDVYNNSGGFSKKYSNNPVRAGGNTEYHTFIKVPQSVLNAINSSSVSTALRMEIYVDTAGSEIDIGSHNHNNSRATGSRGIPSYSYVETDHSINSGWNNYEMTNWFKPRLLNGSVKGIVLYSYQGTHFLKARGIGQSGSVQFRVTGQWEPDAKASIPTLSKSTFNIGERIYISTDRNKDNLTHIVQFSLGSIEKEEITRSVTGSTGWTPSNDLAQEITKDTEKIGTIYLLTYEDGNKYIGTKSVNFKLKVPDIAEFRPTIKTINISEAISDLNAKFGSYIKGESKLNISFTSSGAYGSTIKNKTISVNEENYNSSNVTTGYLTISGDLKVIMRITDSRGRTVSKEETISVVDYNTPSITKFNVFRANANGSLNDEGEYAKVEVTGNIIPLNNKNNKIFKLKYKKTEETNYSVMNLNSTSYELNTSALLPGIDGNFTYDIVFEVSDYFSTREKSESLSTAFTLINCHEDGKHIAFGKVSEGKSTVEVAGDAEIEGLIYSEGYKIFDSGENLNGEYIKFSNGTLICYIQKDEISISASARTEGNLSAYFKDAVITFPSAFIDIPAVVVDANSLTKTMVNVFSNSYSRRVTENNFYLRSWANTQFDKIVDVSVIAIGRWK